MASSTSLFAKCGRKRQERPNSSAPWPPPTRACDLNSVAQTLLFAVSTLLSRLFGCPQSLGHHETCDLNSVAQTLLFAVSTLLSRLFGCPQSLGHHESL